GPAGENPGVGLGPPADPRPPGGAGGVAAPRALRAPSLLSVLQYPPHGSLTDVSHFIGCRSRLCRGGDSTTSTAGLIRNRDARTRRASRAPHTPARPRRKATTL